jgi:CheY-like chemotaxis protein
MAPLTTDAQQQRAQSAPGRYCQPAKGEDLSPVSQPRALCWLDRVSHGFVPTVASRRELMMSERTRVLIADDHRAMLDTLVRMLSRDFDVVAAVMDGIAVVTRAEQLEPDLLVIDIAMPGLNGIAAAARLKERGSSAKVVFVTNMRDREFVEESLALGDVGFVVKDRLVADLLPAIRQVLAGRAFISPTLPH